VEGKSLSLGHHGPRDTSPAELLPGTVPLV